MDFLLHAVFSQSPLPEAQNKEGPQKLCKQCFLQSFNFSVAILVNLKGNLPFWLVILAFRTKVIPTQHSSH